MRMKLASVLLAASVVAAVTTPAPAEEPDPKFYVFLCVGQSNMEGFPGIEEQDKTEVERFKMLAAVDFPKLERKKGNWYPAAPPLCRGSTGLGPADYFGRTMVAHLPKDIKVGVANVSVAGCKIELFDKANYEAYAKTAPGWMTNIIKEYGGNRQVLTAWGSRYLRADVLKDQVVLRPEGRRPKTEVAVKEGRRG